MVYRFGDFILDPRTGTVSGPDGPVTLRRQTFRLLEVLLEHAPDLLDRDTLLDQAWGRTALSPNVLPQAVSELRQALGDNAQAPAYIETLHRRGYRVVCEVERLDPGQPDEIQPSVSHPVPSERLSRIQTVALGLTVVALVLVSTLWWNEASERRWLHAEVIPEIRTLMEADTVSAWRRVLELRQKSRGDPSFEQLWLDLSLPTDLTSEPEGALIEVKGYRELEEDWIVLGTSPIEQARLPIAQLRFRVSKPGYQTLETAPSILPRPAPFILHPEDEAPAGMVYVPSGPVTYMRETRQMPAFWIDRLEVTNAEFRQFIDDGGYHRPEFWQYPAVDNGRELSWQELMARFVDTTGMPGPADWAMGTYPEGKADHPVEGVSWFEAAAYAAYAGKQLPTVFHWYRAAGLNTEQQQQFADIVVMSNFNSQGTTSVGAMPGLGQYGTLDMAGNVAEWTYNADGERRHILGGSWMEAQYRFRDFEAWTPLERRPGFGLRLMQAESSPDPQLYGSVSNLSRDFDEPVDDATFSIYARQFDYDISPLNARIERIDNSHPDWRREWVSFDAAYRGERMIAQVILPRHFEPPLQAVFYYPAGYALLLDSSDQAGLQHVEFFLRSGRAVIYPVLYGTFERKAPTAGGPVSLRNQLTYQIQDLRRTIDYVQSRDEIDADRLLLYGISYGGIFGPYALAVEPRFRAAIMISTGMVAGGRLPSEIQQQHFLPRVTLPFLLVNGKYDFNFPPETSQQPFFDLIGTPEEHKRQVVFETGHIPPHFSDVIRVSLEWTDQWLGPVETPGQRIAMQARSESP